VGKSIPTDFAAPKLPIRDVVRFRQAAGLAWDLGALSGAHINTQGCFREGGGKWGHTGWVAGPLSFAGHGHFYPGAGAFAEGPKAGAGWLVGTTGGGGTAAWFFLMGGAAGGAVAPGCSWRSGSDPGLVSLFQGGRGRRRGVEAKKGGVPGHRAAFGGPLDSFLGGASSVGRPLAFWLCFNVRAMGCPLTTHLWGTLGIRDGCVHRGRQAGRSNSRLAGFRAVNGP